MKLGIGVADITPSRDGITLSGFISRQNRPSEKFGDPLSVRCLAFGEAEHTHLLFAYDLLGIGTELWQQLQDALVAGAGERFSPQRTIFTATHTHSAPATIYLEGVGVIEPGYWEQVKKATIEAAREGLSNQREAELRLMQQPIENLSFIRRRICNDGKSHMVSPDQTDAPAEGPLDNLLSVFGWFDADEKCIAAAVHFACHPVCNGSQTGTSDYPGVLCLHVGKTLAAPCLFLQGACGDTNPIHVAKGYNEAIRFGEQIVDQLGDFAGRMKAVATRQIHSSRGVVPLEYERGLDRDALRREMEQFETIADWRPDSPSAERAIHTMADIMNVDPNEMRDMEQMAYNARALATGTRRSLAALEKDRIPPCPFHAAVWNLGGICFAFGAAELFASTGFRLKEMAKGKLCLPVAYCAPVVGYVPPRGSIPHGGYEVEHAWRYYGHPSRFAVDSEERILQEFERLLGS